MFILIVKEHAVSCTLTSRWEV